MAARQAGAVQRQVDVTDRDAIFAFINEARSKLRKSRRVHVLVNNAGGVLGQVGHPLEEVPPEDWNAIIAVNLSAAFYFRRLLRPQ